MAKCSNCCRLMQDIHVQGPVFLLNLKPLLCAFSFCPSVCLPSPPLPSLSSHPPIWKVSPRCNVVTGGGPCEGDLSGVSSISNYAARVRGLRQEPAACLATQAASPTSAGPAPLPGSLSSHLALGQRAAQSHSTSIAKQGKSDAKGLGTYSFLPLALQLGKLRLRDARGAYLVPAVSGGGLGQTPAFWVPSQSCFHLGQVSLTSLILLTRDGGKSPTTVHPRSDPGDVSVVSCF